MFYLGSVQSYSEINNKCLKILTVQMKRFLEEIAVKFFARKFSTLKQQEHSSSFKVITLFCENVFFSIVM